MASVTNNTNQVSTNSVANNASEINVGLTTQHKSHLPLSNIGKVLASKALGGLGRFLDGVARAHEDLDNTSLVLELKKKFSHPLAIRAFSEVNLAFLRGCLKNLEEYNGQNSFKESNKRYFSANEVTNLINELKSAEKKLLRDLATDICDKSSKAVLLTGLTADKIRNIKAPELPKILTFEDYIAYKIIITGSAIGAAIQYKRQKNSYGLNSSLNGGAEYLASPGNAPIQVVKLFNLSRKVGATLSNQDSLNQSVETGNRLFRALTNIFELAYDVKFCSVSSLKDCSRGTTGTVHRVIAADNSAHRLSEMGFVSGAKISVRQNNGYGIIIEVEGTQYGLNATYARAIHIVVD